MYVIDLLLNTPVGGTSVTLTLHFKNVTDGIFLFTKVLKVK